MPTMELYQASKNNHIEGNFYAKTKACNSGILIGCIVFGLGSLIVAHVPVGAYAIAFGVY